MSVAHDAVSESHTGTTGDTSSSSFGWTHTPLGTPKGVAVWVYTIAGSSRDTGVTYGGVSMERRAFAYDTAGEPCFVNLYVLETGVPTGAQTITVSRTNDATVMYAHAVTVTSGSNVQWSPWMTARESGLYAEVALDDGSSGQDSVRYAGAFWGGNNVPTTGANSTALIDIDFGNFTIGLVRETTAGQGSRSVGFTEGSSDDRAMIAVCAREVDMSTGVRIETTSFSHIGTTSISEASFSWTHPGLAPRHVWVAVVTEGSATAKETGVTYGGNAMSLVSSLSASDTATEPGITRVYELANPPSGSQTVTVTRTNDVTDVVAGCAATKGPPGTYSIDTASAVLLQENGTFSEQAVNPSSGQISTRFVAAYAGGPEGNIVWGSVTSPIDADGMSSASAWLGVEGVPGTGSRNVGITYATSDDRGAAHFAVVYVPSTGYAHSQAVIFA